MRTWPGYLIGEHADFNADSGVDGDDPWRWFVYDERWRVIASYRGTDEAVEADAKERFVYHAAGFRSSGSYIDDLILRDRDAVQPEADPANTDPAETWLFESDGVLEERVFICQNWRADAALVVDSSGAAVQRAWYTAYGVPTGADRADLNGDGVVDSADASVFSAWHGASDIRADWNLDGTVNSTDTIAYLNSYNSAATLGGRGVLSSAALDLRAGYAGYRWDAFTQRYHVRHRVYEPYMGRWLNRDPVEYVDGFNLYQYVGSDPLRWGDFTGLHRDWFDRAVDFSAGVSDSLSFGLTDVLREALGWNDTVNHRSGSYIAGEVTEIVAEVVVTGGSSVLIKKAGKEAAEYATREAAKRAIRKDAATKIKSIDRSTEVRAHIFMPLAGYPASRGTSCGLPPISVPLSMRVLVQG